jgi:hypothetical protein
VIIDVVCWYVGGIIPYLCYSCSLIHPNIEVDPQDSKKNKKWMPWLISYVNETLKKYWNPTASISYDDELWRFHGCGGKANPKKKDLFGIPAWLANDSKVCVFCVCWCVVCVLCVVCGVVYVYYGSVFCEYCM